MCAFIPLAHASGEHALLPATPAQTSASYGDKSVFRCPVEKLSRQEGQPRQYFDEQELAELTASIKEHGLIEPLVVRRAAKATDHFEIIAGERRWRAAQRAGLKEVLVVVKDVSPKEAFELALVENLQRADLNPIEVAESFDRLVREHGYTQQVLADRVGKDRTTIVNSLRLLKLPVRIRELVVTRELSEGHARALLGAPDDKTMADVAEKTVRGRLPVRKVEALIRAARGKPSAANEKKNAAKASAAIRDLEARLMRRLGTRVEVRDHNGRGELGVAYGSLDDLDRILKILGA